MADHNTDPVTAQIGAKMAEKVSDALSWRELLQSLGLDLAIYFAVPALKDMLFPSKISAVDQEILAKAKEHFERGEKKEAFELLQRHPFGVGKTDEEIIDEDLEAAVRGRFCKSKEARNLESFLAGDPRIRTIFRNTLTLQKDPIRRTRLVGVYAKLTNLERIQRLMATGKLDPTAKEIVWDWVKDNVPGMTRTAWDALCNATQTVFSGTGPVANAGRATDAQFDAWGTRLQAYARRGLPAPPATPARTERTFIEWLEDLFA